MATTQVVLRAEMGLRVPSIASVPIAAGGGVSIAAGDGAASALYFSPATAAILSPSPGARVDLAAGSSVTYSFTAAGTSAYGVVTQAPEAPPPSSFDFGAPSSPPALVVQPSMGGGFPVGAGPGGGG
jgi:hypothetical protein